MVKNIFAHSYRAIFLLSIALTTVTNAQQLKFPDTPQGKIVRTYIEAFNSGEENKLQEFFLNNVSKEGLAQRSVDMRVERTKMFRSEAKSLTPQKILNVNETLLGILARTGNGDLVTLSFEFDETPLHKFSGLRIEMGEEEPEEFGPPMMRDDIVPELEKYLNVQTNADKFSGAVLVARDSSVIFSRGYGYADKRFNVPNRIDTKFNLGSINKFFTRIAIGQLAQGGKLSLDEKISKYLPEYSNTSVAEKVTIKHLLAMTSGLGDFFGEKYERTPKEKIRMLQDYLPFFIDEPLKFEPGAQREYSNAGYIVLGLIIEKISGQDYYTYVREHIFQPAGMTNTDSYEMDAVTPNLATGYTHPESNDHLWVSNIYSAPGRGSSAGGGYSTVEDAHKFLLALRSGKLLSPKYTAWLLAGDLPATDPTLPVKQGGFGIAGGAPGINSTIDYEAGNGNIIIVFGNYEPPAAMDVAKKIRGFMRRFVE